MKSLDSSISSMVGDNVTTLATCWTITSPRSGEVLRFTSHTKSLIIGGLVFSSVDGYTPGQITTSLNLSVDNLNVEGFLSVTGITRDDILSGKWDFAPVTIFLVDYNNPVLDAGKLRKGSTGQVQVSTNDFEVEIRGITDRLQTRFVKIYAPLCRVDLGDAECKVRLQPPLWTATTAFTVREIFLAETGSVVRPTVPNGRQFKCIVAGTSGASEPAWDLTIGNPTVDGTVTWETIQALTLEGTVTSVTNNRIFTDTGRTEANDFWQFGKLTWLTGLNAQVSMEVKDSTSGGLIELAQLMFKNIQVGDTYSVEAGCDKSLANHCRDKFDNTINFRGEPYVPQKQELSVTSL